MWSAVTSSYILQRAKHTVWQLRQARRAQEAVRVVISVGEHTPGLYVCELIVGALVITGARVIHHNIVCRLVAQFIL